MALVLADRVRDTTTTTGTGTVTLSGTAPTGYQNFSVVGDGNTTYYTINAASQWEVGIGTYSSTGPTLSRTTVLASSNGGALVDFAAGTKDVFVTYPAEKSVNYDDNGQVVIGVGGPSDNALLDVEGNIYAASAIRAGGGIDLPSGFGNYWRASLPSGAYQGGLTYNGGLRFYSGDVVNERMRITSAGNVGIGTSSPDAALDVAKSTGNFILRDGTTANASIFMTATGSSYAEIQAAKYGINYDMPLVLQRQGGNVGIGISSPDRTITAARGAGVACNFSLRGNGNGASTEFIISQEGDNSAYVYQRANSPLIFGTNNTERMRLDATGNLGIGTSSTGGGRLTVAGGNGIIVNGNGASGYNAIQFINDAGITLSVSASGSTAAGWSQGLATVGTVSNHALVFGTNSTERMRISPSGNLGIGTTDPLQKLDVRGNSFFSGDMFTYQNGGIFFNGNGSYGGAGIYARSTGSDLVLAANGGEGARLTATGFGIGTTSYSARLAAQVNSGNYIFDLINGSETGFALRTYNHGSASAPGLTFTQGLYYGTTENTAIKFYRGSGGTGGFMAFTTYDGAEKMQLDGSGNLRVWATGATVSAGVAASPVGSLVGTFEFTGYVAGYGAGIKSYIPSGSPGIDYQDLRFYTAAGPSTPYTERMRIDPTGNVGIGTSTTTYKLNVAGDLYLGGGGDLRISSATGGNDTSLYNDAQDLFFVVNGSTRAYISSTGRFMVGTTTGFDATVGADFMAYGNAGSAAAFKVNSTSSTQVSFYDSTQSARVGWIGTSGSATSYNTTSDARLKTDVQPVGDVGDKIDAIQIISHKWKNGTDAVIPYAVLAQDLHEIAPHAVTKGDEGEDVKIEWGVDYSKLVPMLVKELQSLRARVAQLEGK